MASQLWDTFKESITVYTGLSPTAFFTVTALGLAVYYVVSGMFGSSDHRPQSRPRSFEEEMQPLPPPVQLGEITEEELRDYDGTDSKKPLLMAIKGQIYDVSQSRMFYGPGGPYALFAGKDASRALAKMSFEDKDLNGDLAGLGVFELEALQDWEYKFMSKYVKVGSIKKSEPAPVTAETPATVEPVQEVSASESTHDHPAESTHDHPAESADGGAPEHVEDAPTHHAVAEPKETASVTEP